MLASVGAQYCLVSYNAITQLHGNGAVRKTVASCVSKNICPVVCIGESIEDFELGLTREVCTVQLSHSLPILMTTTARSMTNSLIVAYTPQWHCTTIPRQTNLIAFITSTVRSIRKNLARIIGEDDANTTRILFGGKGRLSMDTYRHLLQNQLVDGFIVEDDMVGVNLFTELVALCGRTTSVSDLMVQLENMDWYNRA